MTSIEGLVQQVQELTYLTQAQVRTIEEKDAEIAQLKAACDAQGVLTQKYQALALDAAQAQAPEAATGYPLAVLTLGGIDGDEFDSWDLEVFSGDAIDKLQQQLVRSSKPVILNLYAAELAAPQQHAQAAQADCYHDDTVRQGAIWEVCQQCGKRWADDVNPRSAEDSRVIGNAAAQPIAGELPPLPELPASPYILSTSLIWDGKPSLVYMPAQLQKFARTYGHQCRAAALEEAAKMCEGQQKLSDENIAVLRGAAAAIRALNKGGA